MTISKIDITDKIINQPVLIDMNQALKIHSAYPTAVQISLEESAYTFGSSAPSNGKPYQVINGVAVLTVMGTLLHRLGFSGRHATGYDSITAQIDMAESDPDVDGIALWVDSNGGLVSGCFECSDRIHQTTKPTIAMVDSNAHSAGYALASAADKIYMTRTASAGSIGVVTMHVDYSQAIKNEGVKPTFIFAGDHKVDGNPYEPLADGVRAEIQERIDSLYNIFTTTVARNRGIGVDAVRNTQAATYGSEEAIRVGLADVIATPEEALAAFAADLSGTSNYGDTNMSVDNTKGAGSQTAEVPTLDEKAIAAAAVAAERARISDILNSEEATGRDKLASHIAMSTDMSVTDAKAMLSVSPKAEVKAAAQAETQAPVNHFAAAMAASDNPEVGVNSASADESAETSGVKNVFAIYDRAHGRV